MDQQRITARRIIENERISALPKRFGIQLMLVIENTIYDMLSDIAPDYKGGYWHFYTLTNGGFYMAPESDTLRIGVKGNGFQGDMSADAAGITACLFAFDRLATTHGNDALAEHYHWLREFALEHPECCKVMQAVD